MFNFFRCRKNTNKPVLPDFEKKPIIISKEIDINDLFNKNTKILKIKNDEEEINGWSKSKNKNLKKWKNDIEYQWMINVFILYDLKDNESLLTWFIILISTISSSLSVVQFGDESYQWLEIYLKASLSVSTVLTTLIAAWLKKNNYVERINNLDKYLQKVTTLYYNLENIYINDFKDRCSYEIYIEKHKDDILGLLSDVPSYSPYEYKKILYRLTKYFPDLVDGKYPWYDNGERDMRDFGAMITHTYNRLKYETCFSKIFSCYYCKCKCFCRRNINVFIPPLSKQNKYLYPDPEDPDPKADPKAESKPDPKAESKPEPKAESKPEPNPKADPKADPKAKTDPKKQNIVEKITDLKTGK